MFRVFINDIYVFFSTFNRFRWYFKLFLVTKIYGLLMVLTGLFFLFLKVKLSSS